MEHPDEKLKDLMKVLADTISQVFSGNEEIRETLSMIEHEGYHIDLLLASVARVSKKEEDEHSEHSDAEVRDYDRSFLRKIRIKSVEEV
ncbi:MAG: hypothetical protein PH343_07335 [Nitrospira sp.]|nr:hypothetical protein [Nitrospira sp.]